VQALLLLLRRLLARSEHRNPVLTPREREIR